MLKRFRLVKPSSYSGSCNGVIQAQRRPHYYLENKVLFLYTEETTMDAWQVSKTRIFCKMFQDAVLWFKYSKKFRVYLFYLVSTESAQIILNKVITCHSSLRFFKQMLKLKLNCF